MAKLVTGAIKIAVVLMVMATEIDVSMSVYVFEEKHIPNLFRIGFSVNMMLKLDILTGRSSMKHNLQLYYFYVRADKAVFEEPTIDDSCVL